MAEGQYIPNKNCAYFMFGRFQPPHKGHLKMIQAAFDAPAAADCDLYVFVSASQDNNKNPLPVDLKVEILNRQISRLVQQAQFNNRHVDVIGANRLSPPSVGGAIKYLKDLNYERLVLVVGGDRERDFAWVKKLGVELEVVARPEGAISGTEVREIINERLKNANNDDERFHILREKLEDPSLGNITDTDIRNIYYGVKGEGDEANAADTLTNMLDDPDNFDPREGLPLSQGGRRKKTRKKKRKSIKKRRKYKSNKNKKHKKERFTKRFRKIYTRFTKGRFMNLS